MEYFDSLQELRKHLTKTQWDALTGASMKERIKMVASGKTRDALLEYAKGGDQYSTVQGIEALHDSLGRKQYDIKFGLDRDASEIQLQIVQKSGNGAQGKPIKPVKIPLTDTLGQFQSAGRNISTIDVSDVHEGGRTFITDAVGATLHEITKALPANGKMWEGIGKEDPKQLNYLVSQINEGIKEGTSSQKGTSEAARLTQGGTFYLSSLKRKIEKNIYKIRAEAARKGFTNKQTDIKYFKADIKKFLFATMEGIKDRNLTDDELYNLIKNEIDTNAPYLQAMDNYGEAIESMRDYVKMNLNYNIMKEEEPTNLKGSIASYAPLPGGELGRIANRIPQQTESGLVEGTRSKNYHKTKTRRAVNTIKIEPKRPNKKDEKKQLQNTVKLRGIQSAKVAELIKADARKAAEQTVLEAKEKNPKLTQDQEKQLYDKTVEQVYKNYRERDNEEQYEFLRLDEGALNNLDFEKKVFEAFLAQKGLAKDDSKITNSTKKAEYKKDYDEQKAIFEQDWQNIQNSFHSGGAILSQELLSQLISPYDFQQTIGLKAVRGHVFKQLRDKIDKQLKKIDKKKFTDGQKNQEIGDLVQQMAKFTNVDDFLNKTLKFHGQDVKLSSLIGDAPLTSLLNSVNTDVQKEATKWLENQLGSTVQSVAFTNPEGKAVDWLKDDGIIATGLAQVDRSNAKLMIGGETKVNPAEVGSRILQAMGAVTGHKNIQGVMGTSNKDSARKIFGLYGGVMTKWVMESEQKILATVSNAVNAGSAIKRREAMNQGLLHLNDIFEKSGLGFLKDRIYYDDDLMGYFWKEDPIVLIANQFKDSDPKLNYTGNAEVLLAKAMDTWAHGEGQEEFDWTSENGIAQGKVKAGQYWTTVGTAKLANEPDYSGFTRNKSKNLKGTELLETTIARDIGENNVITKAIHDQRQDKKRDLEKLQQDVDTRIENSRAKATRQEQMDELKQKGAIFIPLEEFADAFMGFDYDGAYADGAKDLTEDAYNELMDQLNQKVKDIAKQNNISEDDVWKNLYLDFGEKGAATISDYGDKKYNYESYFFQLNGLNKHRIAPNMLGVKVAKNLSPFLMPLVKQARKFGGSQQKQDDKNTFLHDFTQYIYNDVHKSGEGNTETTFDKFMSPKLKGTGYFKAVAYNNPNNDVSAITMNEADIKDYLTLMGNQKGGKEYYEEMMKYFADNFGVAFDAKAFRKAAGGTTELYKKAMFNSILDSIKQFGISAMALRYPMFSGRNANFGRIYIDKSNTIAQKTLGASQAFLEFFNGDVDGDRLLISLLSGMADSPDKVRDLLNSGDKAVAKFKPILERMQKAYDIEAANKTSDNVVLNGKVLEQASNEKLQRLSGYYAGISKSYTTDFSNLNTAYRNITHAADLDETIIENANNQGVTLDDATRDKVLHTLATRTLTNTMEQLPISSKKIIEHFYNNGTFTNKQSDEEQEKILKDVVGNIKKNLGQVDWGNKDSITKFMKENLVEYGFFQDEKDNKRFIKDVGEYQQFIGFIESAGLLDRLAAAKGMDVNSDEFKALIDPESASGKGITLTDFIDLLYGSNQDFAANGGITIRDARDSSKLHRITSLNDIFQEGKIATAYSISNASSGINETNMAYKVGKEIKDTTDVLTDAGKELAKAAGVTVEGFGNLADAINAFISVLGAVGGGGGGSGINLTPSNFLASLSKVTFKDMVKKAADVADSDAFSNPNRNPATYKAASKLAHNLFPTGMIYAEDTKKKEYEQSILDNSNNTSTNNGNASTATSNSKPSVEKIKGWMNPNNFANSAEFGSYIHDVFGAILAAKEHDVEITDLTSLYDMLNIDDKDLQEALTTSSRKDHPEEAIKQSLLNIKKVQLQFAQDTKDPKSKTDPTSTAFLDKGFLLAKGMADLFSGRTSDFKDFKFYGTEIPMVWSDVRHSGTPRQGFLDYLYSYKHDNGFGQENTYLTVGDMKSISGRNGAPGGADIAQILEYVTGLRVLQQYLLDNQDIKTVEDFNKRNWGLKLPRLSGQYMSQDLFDLLRDKNVKINNEFATYDRVSGKTKIFSMAQNELTDGLMAQFHNIVKYAEENQLSFDAAASALYNGAAGAGQAIINQLKGLYVSTDSGETYANYENNRKSSGVLSKYKKLATKAAEDKLRHDELKKELDNPVGLDEKTRAEKQEQLKQLKIIKLQSQKDLRDFKKENDQYVNDKTGSMRSEVGRVNKTIKAANTLKELEDIKKQAEEKLEAYLKLKKEAYEIEKRKLDRKILNKEFLTPAEQALYDSNEEKDAAAEKENQAALKTFEDDKDFKKQNQAEIERNALELNVEKQKDTVKRAQAEAAAQQDLLDKVKSSYLNEARLANQIGQRNIQMGKASPEMQKELAAQNAIDQAEIEKLKKTRKDGNWEAQIKNKEELKEVTKDVALQTDAYAASLDRLNVEANPTMWDNMKKSFQGWLKSLTSGALIWTFAAQARRSINNIIQGAQKLDAVLTDLRIVTGNTREETKSLMTSYAKLGRKLSASTSEVASAANTWLRQGYSISEVNDLISASMHLSKLGMIDSGKATEYLTSMLKGFKLEATDAMSVVDKLTKVDMVAATSAGDIAESLRQFATTAQLSGVDLDQAIAMATTIMDVSQAGASTVGIALKSMLSRFGNVKAGAFTGLDLDSETGEVGSESLNDLEKVLKKLGISMRDTNLQFRDFDDVLEDIASQWSLYDNVTKNAIATAAAGTRQREAFLVLMENMDKYHSLLETSQNAEGTAEEKYLSYQDSLQAAQKRLSAVWEEIALNSDVSRFMTNLTNLTTFLVKQLPFIAKWTTRIFSTISATKVPVWINKAFNSLGINQAVAQTVGFVSTKLNNVSGLGDADKADTFFSRNVKSKPSLGTRIKNWYSHTGLAKTTKKIDADNKKDPNSLQNSLHSSNAITNTLIGALNRNTSAINSNTEAQGGKVDADNIDVNTVPTKGSKLLAAGKAIGAVAATFAFGALAGYASADTQHTTASGETVENSKDAQMASSIGNAAIGGVSSALQMGGFSMKVAGLILQIAGPWIMQEITKAIDAERDARAERVEAANNIVKAINSLENVTSTISDKIETLTDSMSTAEWITKIDSVEDTLNSEENKETKAAIWEQLSSNDKYKNVSNISEFFDLMASATGKERAEMWHDFASAQNAVKQDSMVRAKEEEAYQLGVTDRKYYSLAGISAEGRDEKAYRQWADAHEDQLDFERNETNMFFKEKSRLLGIAEGMSTVDKIQMLREYQSFFDKNSKGWKQLEGAIRELTKVEKQNSADRAAIYKESNKQLVNNAIEDATYQGRRLLDLTDYDLSNLSSDQIREAIRKDVQAKGGFNGISLYGEKSDQLLDQAIAGNSKLYAALQGHTKTLNQVIENNDVEIQKKFASALGVTREQLLDLQETLGELTLADLIGGLENLRTKAGEVTETLQNIVSAGGLSAEAAESLLSKHPELVRFTGDPGAMATQLIKQGNAYSVAYQRGMMQELMGSSALFAELRKELHKNTFNGTNLEDALFSELNKPEGAKALFNGAKSLSDVYSRMSSAATLNDDDLMKKYGLSRKELERVQALINEYYQVTVKDPIKEAQFNMFSQHMQKVYEKQITNLNEQKSALQEITSQREYENKLIEAKIKLENAQQEKKRVWREGVGWSYESDQSAIEEAQKNLDSVNIDYKVAELESQITQLQAEKDELANIEDNESFDRMSEAFESFKTELGKTFESQGDVQKALQQFYKQIETKISRPTEEDANAVTGEKTSDLDKAAQDLMSKKAAMEQVAKDHGVDSEEYYNAEKAYNDSLTNFQTAYKNFSTENAEAADIWKNNTTTDGVKNNDLLDYQESSSFKPQLKFNGQTYDVDLDAYNHEQNDGDAWIDTSNTSNNDDVMRYYAYKGLHNGVPKYADAQTIVDAQTNEYGAGTLGLLEYMKARGMQTGTIIENKTNGNKLVYINGATSDFPQGGSVEPGFYKLSESSNVEAAAEGSTGLAGGPTLVNELGTEAIISPWGTLTALPSATGVVPADITKNLWQLGEMAPSILKLLAQSSAFNNLPIASLNNGGADNSLNINSLTMNVNADESFDIDSFTQELRNVMNLTRRERR